MSRIIEIIDSDEETTAPQLSITEVIEGNVTKPNTNTITITAPTTATTTTTEVKKNRRKSALHPQDAEVQFETIYVDEEDEEMEVDSESVQSSRASCSSKSKSMRAADAGRHRARRLVASRKCDELETMFNEFMTSEETVSTIRKIAEERIRLNFLWTSTMGAPLLDLQLKPDYVEMNKQLEEHLK